MAERPQLREFRQQHGADDGPDAGHALEQVVLGPPDGTPLDLIGEVLGDIVELALEPPDVLVDPVVQGAGREAEAVLLGDQHLQQLPAAGEEGIE